MLVSVERANLGDQPGDGDPPDPRQRGEIRRLVKRLEEGLELVGDLRELVPDAVDTLHQPGYFPHGGFMPMWRRHRPPGFLPDLLNLEAPHPSSAPVRLHDSYEIWLRQVGNSLRRQARPQHREASRSRDRFPLADQFREDAVELMHQQGLESCALAAKAMVFPPGPPQLHVVGGEELALGDDSRAKQLCDLLRVGEVSLVSTHLPGLAHPKGRQRIDHVIPKCVLLKEGTDRLPHVPGRLEREVHLSSSPADTRRGAALHKLVETLPGMWNLEARETAALRIEDDDLVLAGRQIDTHEEIV